MPDFLKKRLMFATIMVASIITAIMLGFTIAANSVKTSGDSMNPTLYTGDLLFGSFLPFENKPLKRGDLVVFKDKDHWHQDDIRRANKKRAKTGEKPQKIDDSATYNLVKRAVAIEGDTVHLNGDGTMTVNGKQPQYDKNYNLGCLPYASTFKVPKGYIFVRGDNVNHSIDSRYRSCFYPHKPRFVAYSSIEFIVRHVMPIGRMFKGIVR